MYCLYCGDCCRRMSPLGNPCPKLVEPKSGFFFCSDYEHRPQVCRDHEFSNYRFCPVGLMTLGWVEVPPEGTPGRWDGKIRLNVDADQIRQRIDDPSRLLAVADSSAEEADAP